MLLCAPALSAANPCFPLPGEAHFSGEKPAGDGGVSVRATHAETSLRPRLKEAIQPTSRPRPETGAFAIVLLRAGSAEGKALLAKRPWPRCADGG